MCWRYLQDIKENPPSVIKNSIADISPRFISRKKENKKDPETNVELILLTSSEE